MRAVYENIEPEINNFLELGDENDHHLRVVRVKVGDDLLLINGSGALIDSKITEITKNKIIIQIISINTKERNHEISLAVALPKKDATEEILKIATELGVVDIYPLTSNFSQHTIDVKADRVHKLLVSAAVQSNNPWLPKIHPQNNLADFIKQVPDLKSTVIFFNSRPENKPQNLIRDSGNAKKIILIGPEGGFSQSEIADITSMPSVQEIYLPTPILRSPTATSAAIGYLLASNMQK